MNSQRKNKPADAQAKPPAIHTHQQLAAKIPVILAQLNANPELVTAMLINPAAAIQEAGFRLGPEIASHVMETARFSKTAATRRDHLQKSLETSLGEPPQPMNPAWVRNMLFEKLRIQPLETAGVEPVYRDAITAAERERLQRLRPVMRRAAVKTPKPLHGVAVIVDLIHKSPLRFDLDAKLPAMKPAAKPPENVDLNTLYLYKDSHPAIRDLIELTVLTRSAFPIHTPESYRQIRSGAKPNPLRTWVKTVRFGRP